MKRLLVAATVLALGVIIAHSQTFVPFSFNLGGIQNAGTAVYSGPGDVASGAFAWWGLRAYNQSYAASKGKIANICTPSDVVCADVNSDTNGNFNLAGTPSLTCNNSTSICTVKTLYDQSGASNCSGACNVTQAVAASRSSLTLSCLGAKFCMTFNGTQQLVAGTANSTQNQPYTLTCAAERTGNTSNFNDCLGWTIPQIGFNSAANQLLQYAGSVVGIPGYNDNTWIAMVEVFNGASSVTYANGTSTSTSPGATAIPNSAATVGAGNNPLTGTMFETGIWPSGLSASAQAAMNNNMRAYWGF